MSAKLIINLRHQLPWYRRYLSNTTTALLWMGWIGLWKPLLVVAMGFIAIHRPHLFEQVLGAISIQHYLVILFACAISLWMWATYIPAKRVQHLNRYNSQDYANFYQLDRGVLTQAQDAKNLTVFHNQTGKIVDLRANVTVSKDGEPHSSN